VRRLSALVAAASAVVFLAAVPVAAQQVAVDPPPLRIVTSFPVNSMNPSVQGSGCIEYGVGEMLMQFRSDGQFHPWLAKDVQRSIRLHWKITPPSRGQIPERASR